MDKERIMQIATIEREARELEQSLEIIDSQIWELENFRITLKSIVDSKEDEVLAPIGSRVYLKSMIKDKKSLFVEVGAGVVIKKTPEETLNTVGEQIMNLKEARLNISSNLEELQDEMKKFIIEVEEN